jgi:hypothetical protein
MRDIFVLAGLIFPARHCDKKPLFTLNDFDIVNHEAVIESDGNIGPQFTFAICFSNPNIC